MSDNITLKNYTENVYFYMKKSKAFVLSSLWEEVGFVIVEAAFCNTTIISSNCMNGPKEFLINGKAGLIFENNKKDDLFKKFEVFKKLEKEQIFKKKILAKKNTKNLLCLDIFKSLKQIIQNH